MFNPEDFLKFTEIIRRQPKLQTEAGIRTALNRAYYAALVNAKTKLEVLGVIFPDNDTIHQVISQEVKIRDNVLADILEDLYDYRFDSDFDLNYNVDHSMIAPVIGMAKRFNNRAKSKLK